MPDRLPLACMYINRQTQDNFAIFCQDVKNGMAASSVTFPTPPITLVVFQGLIDAYVASLASAALLGKQNIQAKNSAKADLIAGLRTICAYVNSTIQEMILTGTTYAAARTLILGTNFFESSNPDLIGPLPSPVIKRFRSTVRGQFAIQVGRVKGAKSYQVLYGPAALPINQLTTTVSPTTRVKINNLPSGSVQQAYVAAVGANQSVLNYSVQVLQVIV